MLRVLAFLARRIVPFAAAWVVGWVVGALFGLTAGLVGAVVAAVAVECISPWVRRRPRLRQRVRVAIVLHVAFWSWQGVRRVATAPAGPVRLLAVSPASAAGPISAGFASASFQLPAHTTLAGWGSQPRRRALPALAGLGPLGALTQDFMAARGEDGAPRRALYTEPTASPGEALGARALWLLAGDGPPLVVVSLDLVTTSRELHTAIAAALAPDGVSPEALLLAATHTHSGPGGFRRERFAAVVGTDHADPAVETAIVTAVLTAVRSARDAQAPARISWADVVLDPRRPLGRARGSLPLGEERVAAMLVADSGGTPRGAVVHAAVHPTVLRRTHLAFGRDLAGAIETQLGADLGGVPVLFLNGAFGDVAPAPTPAASTGPARLLELAKRATSGLAAALRAAPFHERMALAAAWAERDPGTARSVVGLGSGRTLHGAADRALFEGDAGALACDALLLPLNVAAWSLFLPEVRFVGSLDGPAVGLRVALDQLVGREPMAAGVVRLAPAEGASSLTWLWTPGEATRRAGAAWVATARAAGATDAWVLGVTNGGSAYLADPTTMDDGGYEAAATLHGADTAALVGDLLHAAHDALP